MSPAMYVALPFAAGVAGVAIGVSLLWVFFARQWRHEFAEPYPRDMHLFYALIVFGLVALAALALLTAWWTR
jgi:CHASE2 domain-containing sensor protein